MVRGERPIKLRDSWFFAKFIEVKRLLNLSGGRALIELWGSKTLLLSRKLRIPVKYNRQTDKQC